MALIQHLGPEVRLWGSRPLVVYWTVTLDSSPFPFQVETALVRLGDMCASDYGLGDH